MQKQNYPRKSSRFLPLSFALPFFCLGCTYYLLDQGLGQVQLILRRIPIQKLLKEEKLSPSLREKLRWIQEVRQFAHSSLGLPSQGYTYYVDTKGKPVAYNVSASLPLELKPIEWWFPFLGKVPYLGFFDKGQAIAFKAKLANQGYDVILQPVAAYSSLGWWEDPIYSSVLENSEKRDLVELILHEIVHENIYAPNWGEFNENVATFLAKEGTKLFLKQRDPEEAKRYLLELKDKELFQKFITKAYQKLEALYHSSLPREKKQERKQQIFEKIQKEFQELKQHFQSERYRNAFFPEWNNALILSFHRYEGKQALLRETFQSSRVSLTEFIQWLKQSAKAKNPWEHLKALRHDL